MKALRVIVIWIVAAAVVGLVVRACFYNTESQNRCTEAGLTWVKEYPYGDYGCANVIKFEDLP